MPNPTPPSDDDVSANRTRAGVHFKYVADLLGERQARKLLRRELATASQAASVSRDSLIDYVTLWGILKANIEITSDEGHTLAGVTVPRGNFELLVTSMLQGDHLLDGLCRLANGARILRPDLRFKVVSNRGRLHLTIMPASQPTRAKEIYVEALAVVLHCTIRWAVAYPVTPHRVRASSLLCDDDGSMLYVITPRVQRNLSGVTLVYNKDAMHAEFKPGDIRRRDEALYSEYLQLVEPDSGNLAERRTLEADDVLVQRIRSCIRAGSTQQACVARKVGLSVSTLRRHLSNVGQSFRQILDQSRKDTAEVLLLGDRSLDAIAVELGLSDTRSLRRSCTTWFGKSPSEMRAAMRQLQSREQ